MNNKIANTKVEVAKGIQLNEKDYIEKLLTCLKDMEKNYTIAMTEASNEAFFNDYKSIFDEIAFLQREVYEVMFRKGWYTLEEVEEQKISMKYNSLNQEYQDLNA